MASGRHRRCARPPTPRGRAARRSRGRPILRRAAEEELPRDELVPLLRELARALIATEGPGGFPALREALALASGDEREEIVLELGRALLIQGYFTDAAAVFARGTSEEARTELATVSVLDLSLVRAAGGLDALAARPPARRLGGRRVDRGRSPAARGARRRPRRGGAPEAQPSSIAGALSR